MRSALSSSHQTLVHQCLVLLKGTFKHLRNPIRINPHLPLLTCTHLVLPPSFCRPTVKFVSTSCLLLHFVSSFLSFVHVFLPFPFSLPFSWPFLFLSIPPFLSCPFLFFPLFISHNAFFPPPHSFLSLLCLLNLH